MRLATALACLLLPLSAVADRGTEQAPAVARGTGAPVIGGSNAKPGAWPDVAAILFPLPGGDEPLCTGTLVAPNVVLTAAHCYDPQDPPLPDNVLIGTSSLARPGEGETIPIKRAYVYPDPETTEDLAVLVLARSSSRKPRPIATGWAQAELVNGAAVALVGFGAINASGDDYIDDLQEAHTTITDADCTTSPGCNAAAHPAGELGAGGMGIDTCPGDSGGPLYLLTSYGPVLAGLTSRSYDDATVPCSQGGIYVRPDKLIDWIESMAGNVSNIGAPQADPIVVMRGDGGDIRIRVNDPASDAHRFEIVAAPAHGTAKTRDDGAVRFCADPAAAAGTDQLTVMVTDTTHANRKMPVLVHIQIEDGTPAATCDLDGFSEAGGCCSTGGGAGGTIPVALGVLVLVRRRRRRR
jgi:endonuclease G